MEANTKQPPILSPRQLERRGLTINAAKLGVLLLLYQFVFIKYSKDAFLYVYVWCASGRITFDTETLNTYLSESVEYNTAFTMLYSVCVVAAAVVLMIITARLMGLSLMSATFKAENKKQAAKTGVIFFPVAMLVNVAMTYLVNIFESIMESKGTVIPSSDFSIDSPTPIAIILEAAYLVVIAPIAEECIFRGLVLKALAPYGKGLAVVTSALLFGFMHGNLSQLVTAFVTGLVFAAVDVKCRSIIPSVVMHMLNNLLPTVFNIAVAINSSILKLVYQIALYTVVLIGAVVLAVYLKRLKGQEKPEPEEHALSLGHRTLTVALNIPLFIYFAYYIYEIIYGIISANT